MQAIEQDDQLTLPPGIERHPDMREVCVAPTGVGVEVVAIPGWSNWRYRQRAQEERVAELRLLGMTYAQIVAQIEISPTRVGQVLKAREQRTSTLLPMRLHMLIDIERGADNGGENEKDQGH